MKTVSINLNNEEYVPKKIKIIPIADVHIGEKAINLKAFKEAIEKIENEPDTYTILNGDLCNMALKNSKSDVYSDSMTPMEQVMAIAKFLKPLADKGKILVFTSGNHENRTQKETNIDILYFVAKELGIEDRYKPGWWYLYLTFGDGPKSRPITYTLTGYHGSGGGRKSGGKINRLKEMSQVAIADVYLMSHTHEAMSTKGIIYMPDYQHKSVVKKTLNYIMNNSFVDFSGSYAETLGFTPQGNDLVEIELSGEDKHVRLVLD